MQIISERHTVETTSRTHEFEWSDCPGAGFTFDVDENDQIVVTDGNRHNVELCLSGSDPRIIDQGIQVHTHSYTEPRVGRCPCGKEVYLDHFTNTCDCGADYDSSGNRLAPRSQWGWAETAGETLGDILRIP